MNIQFRFGDDLESIKELGPRIYSPVLRVVSNFGEAIVRRVKRTRMREIMRRRGGEGRERSDQESGGNRVYWFLSQNTTQMCLGNL